MAPPLPNKRRRLGKAWEPPSPLLNKQHAGQAPVGLADLFRRPHAANGPNNNNTTTRQRNNNNDNEFFLLRMEHREGGVMARSPGEERLLLFRSDRPGAVAKIIFSSTPAPTPGKSHNRSAHYCYSSGDFSDEELREMAQAKIHVLDVKEQYRGHDLGGLLFSEALSTLRHRYETDDDEEYSLSSAVHCQLDAEEDIRRHNRLVNFYEQLGCKVKPKAKVQYLNNNDGETYRKIPMQIAVKGCCSSRQREHANSHFLAGRRGGFLPIQLLEGEGTRVTVHGRGSWDRQQVEWLVLDDGEGHIQFRSTHGHTLQITPDGKVVAVVSDNEEESDDKKDEDDSWSTFNLCKVPDDEESEDAGKELWMLRSSQHGTFLTITDDHCLACSKNPSFWQAGASSYSLTCTSDTPPRRQHYRKTWARQCVDYVQRMHTRYLGFRLAKLSLREALSLVEAIPCHPFRVGGDKNGQVISPSLRTLCFRTAEAARKGGHPDWVQFIALVYSLGGVVNCIETASSTDDDDDDDEYDWTITSRSRVIGCAAPDRANFGEFRNLNPNGSDERYSSPQGMYDLHCGLLENVLLTWTGPEYMYYMLKHNAVAIPEEGLAMLRLFSLGDWHTHGEYHHLANDDDDEDARPYVANFDQLRRRAREECLKAPEMSDAECDRLWNEHYADLVAKYGAGGELQW